MLSLPGTTGFSAAPVDGSGMVMISGRPNADKCVPFEPQIPNGEMLVPFDPQILSGEKLVPFEPQMASGEMPYRLRAPSVTKSTQVCGRDSRVSHGETEAR